MLYKHIRTAIGVAAISLSCFAAAVDKESVTFNAWQPVQTALANIETGTLRTNVFTVGGYNLGKIKFSGNVTEINGTTFDYGTESRVRVKMPDGRYKDISFTTTADYTGTLAFNGEFGLGMGTAAPFGGGTWNFYYINTYDDTPAGGVPDCEANVTFTLTDEMPTPPGGVIDLGDVHSLSRTDFHNSGDVMWFRVNMTVGTAPDKYVDFDTNGTTTFLGGTYDNDTYMAIFDAAGTLLNQDDDDGEGGIGTSLLTFGPGAGDRGDGGMPGSLYDGRDGDLTAGAYYIAVSGWPMTLGDGFVATTSSIHSGDVVFNVRTNIGGGGGPTVEGDVTLNGFDQSCYDGQLVTVEIRLSGFPLDTRSVALDATGHFSYPLPGTITPGNYDVAVKHAKFLRKTLLNQTITATGIQGMAFSLINGDCNDDNEVGIADFALISTSYGKFVGDPGYDDRADLNCDGEVGIADYAIMSSAYGTFGDD